MFQDLYWAEAGPRHPAAAYPIEAALDELNRAVRDLAFTETAEVVSRNRLRMIEGMIAACEDDAKDAAGSEAEALRDAASTLREERDSLYETRPIEHAFRADQRDLAKARIAAAQSRLRTWVADPDSLETAFDPRLGRQAALRLAQEGIALDSAEVARVAREEAELRLNVPGDERIEPPVPVAGANVAWIAERLMLRARRGQI